MEALLRVGLAGHQQHALVPLVDQQSTSWRISSWVSARRLSSLLRARKAQ